MSMVIDGRDILKDNSHLAEVMSKSLSDLLNGKRRDIPAGVLKSAKNLFSLCMDSINKKTDSAADSREIEMTYQLVTDMLKNVRKIEDKDIDSKLEKLSIAIEILTPNGRQISIDKENYNMLQELFGRMYEESKKYGCTIHSPYSIGAFDDSDE